jgi:hypothetical protein
VTASAAVAEGSGVATMRNPHGVVMDLTGIDRGVKLKFAVEGAQTARTGN